MGQLPSSLKNSRHSLQSESIDDKLNRKLRKKLLKASFRRHSILNLFKNNSEKNSGRTSPDSKLSIDTKFNTKSEINLNKINSSTNSLHKSNPKNSAR